jgi:hypothetical protein
MASPTNKEQSIDHKPNPEENTLPPDESSKEGAERKVGLVLASLLISFQIVFSGIVFYVMLRIPGLFETVLREHFVGIFGSTMSVMTAMVIVVVFRVAAGPIEFETPFGFKFKGASGPVVLWILTYLAGVSGMVALWKVGK